ncbi:MAG: dTDP-4-dehydrorhamnose 3,5-epimerase [Verrucomicrobiales bacterium]
MKFISTPIKDLWIVELELRRDDRGFFARAWCETEFAEVDPTFRPVQVNISQNERKGTLRGLHLQKEPFGEAKLIRCQRGSLFDVAVDLRPESPTFKQHFSIILSATEPRMFFIPKGFAHGFQTLEDDTEILYFMSEYYHPEAAAGYRWNDPAFSIDWPLQEKIMSDRDQTLDYFGVN